MECVLSSGARGVHSVYDAEAAERHWSRILGLFEEELKG